MIDQSQVPTMYTTSGLLIPIRGMTYTMPAFGFGHQIQCSYCNYQNPFGQKVEKVEDRELEDLQKHECHDRCNAFTCKKRLLIGPGLQNEFYVIDEKYFMCYQCMKEGKANGLKFRDYWKIPKGTIHIPLSKNESHRTTEYLRSECPWMHEDLWYSSRILNNERERNDYNIYLKLKDEGIVV